jgi:formyltetrahydrofolate synthetase
MYSNAFLMLHESILTYFIEGDEDIKNMYSDEQTRQKIKNIVKNPYRAKDYKNDNDFNELCKIYKIITPIRNTIAHAIETGRVSSTDINNFENLYYKKVAQIYSKNKSYYLGDYI